uniref:Uncharacterized protein n=1 Tax=Anguilla anguilla TaxID=7936 RepID=A0A0E9SQS6_ANGAN
MSRNRPHLPQNQRDLSYPRVLHCSRCQGFFVFEACGQLFGMTGLPRFSHR